MSVFFYSDLSPEVISNALASQWRIFLFTYLLINSALFFPDRLSLEKALEVVFFFCLSLFCPANVLFQAPLIETQAFSAMTRLRPHTGSHYEATGMFRFFTPKENIIRI